MLLKDVLSPEHLHCWLLFVRAVTILSQYCVKYSDLTTADLLLLNFCREFESLYGEQSCTFNMHLHLHLKKTLSDFGPLHASWCFAFERYNGILGAYHTNNKAIEPQICHRGDSLVNINYNRKSVGVIQYFVEHQLHYESNGKITQEQHVLAYVHWKELHCSHNWFGSSATVCTNMFAGSAACSFLPVQRIAHRCANIVLPTNLMVSWKQYS